MKKFLFMMMAACMTIFSVTNCENPSDNVDDGGDNGGSVEWDIKPEFKESGNTMSLTYQTFWGSAFSQYAVIYGVQFTFNNGICTKADVTLTCKDKELAKSLYTYLKAEESYNYSLDGNTIKADISEDYKGLKQDYLRSFCKATVDIFDLNSSDDDSKLEKKRAYYNVTENKISVFKGSLGYSLSGEVYEDYEFKQGEDWDGNTCMVCVKATITTVFPTENIAEYIYRDEYLNEGRLPDEDYDGDSEEEINAKLEGKKIIVDDTKWQEGYSMESILEQVKSEVEIFNKYYIDSESE